MTREEFYTKYDAEVEFSQSACNALALLNRATEILRDWRSTGGKWNGEDCPHLQFFIYQIVYLTFGREMDWPDWYSENTEIEKRMENRAKYTQEEIEQIRDVELARKRVPSSAMGSFPNLNIGKCPKCEASHAAESVCHACGYEYRDILSHDEVFRDAIQ